MYVPLSRVVEQEMPQWRRLQPVLGVQELEMSYYERTLPHCQPEGRDLFLTWRLSGSLPAEAMAALRDRKTEPMGVRFREYDRELDRSLLGPVPAGVTEAQKSNSALLGN